MKQDSKKEKKSTKHYKPNQKISETTNLLYLATRMDLQNLGL